MYNGKSAGIQEAMNNQLKPKCLCKTDLNGSLCKRYSKKCPVGPETL